MGSVLVVVVPLVLDAGVAVAGLGIVVVAPNEKLPVLAAPNEKGLVLEEAPKENAGLDSSFFSVEVVEAPKEKAGLVSSFFSVEAVEAPKEKAGLVSSFFSVEAAEAPKEKAGLDSSFFSEAAGAPNEITGLLALVDSVVLAAGVAAAPKEKAGLVSLVAVVAGVDAAVVPNENIEGLALSILGAGVAPPKREEGAAGLSVVTVVEAPNLKGAEAGVELAPAAALPKLKAGLEFSLLVASAAAGVEKLNTGLLSLPLVLALSKEKAGLAGSAAAGFSSDFEVAPKLNEDVVLSSAFWPKEKHDFFVVGKALRVN